MFKAIIIDDEQDALELISAILSDNFPEANIVGTSQSPLEGLKLI